MRPLSEKTPHDRIAGLGYAERQLERRPASGITKDWFFALARDDFFDATDPNQTVTKTNGDDMNFYHFATNNDEVFSWSASQRPRINILETGTYYFGGVFIHSNNNVSVGYQTRFNLFVTQYHGTQGPFPQFIDSGPSAWAGTGIGRVSTFHTWGRYTTAMIPDYVTLFYRYLDGDASYAFNSEIWMWGCRDSQFQVPLLNADWQS